MTGEAFEPPTAREAEALASYQAGSLTRYQLQCLLGFDNRWDTEAWLGRMGEHETSSIDDLNANRATLDRLFGPASPRETP